MGFPAPPHLKAQFDAYRAIYRGYQPEDARYLSNHRGHLMFLRPEEQPIITADVIRSLTFTGTAGGARGQRPGDQGRLGYSQFGVHIRTGHEMAMLDDWAEVIAKV